MARNLLPKKCVVGYLVLAYRLLTLSWATLGIMAFVNALTASSHITFKWRVFYGPKEAKIAMGGGSITITKSGCIVH